ncbi:hypothetical protein BH24ACT5_BH24ACT5_27130 [soil metagenome]
MIAVCRTIERLRHGPDRCDHRLDVDVLVGVDANEAAHANRTQLGESCELIEQRSGVSALVPVASMSNSP